MHPALQERGSLSEQAYFILRERILRGELPLGAVLSRRRLATEFGMSLLPVSEALQRLETDGLVESRPRVGTRVRVPSARELREFYVVREALECQSARLFAENASARDRIALHRMAEHTDVLFNQCFSRDADAEFMYQVHSYHFQFHMRIAECTGCGALRDTIEKNHVLIFNWFFDVSARKQPLPPRFHRVLADVLCSGSPDEAERAMREHIRHGIEEILRCIEPRSVSEWRFRKSRAPRRESRRSRSVRI